ncbi:MAG: undecaprenyldiphospho-muramoylpentapeptide beta-N-acetylglucosaminyltransferase [Nitrospinae bacterium]|nr:undecaprenyldiphospho-muramoylpentapeptide beta-N-acetylglucosaminyltransferase [Nitrospinota bacterium]MBI5750088.1 undecaprenyldiphospho-muramoylpentapeptide beta-N-acetylglucosaminyltransferase [Nitrospinota bacterium]
MKVVIAGGGTGGHLFPGIAIAQEFKRLAPESLPSNGSIGGSNRGREGSTEVLFVGTENGIESRIVPREGFEIRYISAEGLKGRGILKKVKSVCKIPIGIIQSIKILNSFRPDIVIGVGGYASGAVGAASFLLGYPLVIQEQNLFPGVTNRILGRFANLIFTSFEETGKFFPAPLIFKKGNGRRVCLTGNPIRRGIVECGRQNADIELQFSAPNSSPYTVKFTILIFGGSQGAHSINKAMADGLEYLAKFKDSIFIIHQAGITDCEFVKKSYEKIGFESEVVPFIHNMADSYKKADLIICRAGATTISEITACGKASILIPFPFAANNHQEMNAHVLKDNGAAEMIIEKDLSGEVLANKILFLMQSRTRLLEMERGSKKMGKPDAAKEIVEQCYELLKSKETGFTVQDSESINIGNYKKISHRFSQIFKNIFFSVFLCKSVFICG